MPKTKNVHISETVELSHALIEKILTNKCPSALNIRISDHSLIKGLADALKCNNVIQHLDLSDNALNDVEVVLISDSLRQNPSIALTSVNLSSNLIHNLGLRGLIFALECNHALLLVSLDLSFNLLDDRDLLERLAKTFPKRVSDEKEKAEEQQMINISGNYLNNAKFPEKEGRSLETLITRYPIFYNNHGPSLKEVCVPSRINEALKNSHANGLIYFMVNENTNHAILMLEGIEDNGQLFLEKAHLVAPQIPNVPVFYPQKGQVLVQAWPFANKTPLQSLQELREYSHQHWERSRVYVEMLRDSLQKQLHKEVLFSILGYGGLNCLTWALKMLAIIEIEPVGYSSSNIPNLFLSHKASHQQADKGNKFSDVYQHKPFNEEFRKNPSLGFFPGFSVKHQPLGAHKSEFRTFHSLLTPRPLVFSVSKNADSDSALKAPEVTITEKVSPPSPETSKPPLSSTPAFSYRLKPLSKDSRYLKKLEQLLPY